MPIETLHITIGQLREIPQEIRKLYVTAWLELNKHLPGDTKVDVTPTSVAVIEVPKPTRITEVHDPLKEKETV